MIFRWCHKSNIEESKKSQLKSSRHCKAMYVYFAFFIRHGQASENDRLLAKMIKLLILLKLTTNKQKHTLINCLVSYIKDNVRKSLPGDREAFSMFLANCGRDDHDISKRELPLGTND